MGEKRSLVLVDGPAGPRARSADLKGRRREAAERFQVLLETPEILILRHEEARKDTERVLMAGEILLSSTVLEIVNLIASSRWVGTLHVYGEDACRSMGFYNGVLRHAQSDHPEDRLDKVLRRIGVLSPAQVEEIMREIRPDQRFGELLIERGMMTRQDLFSYLGKQMEQVLLAAVLEASGSYVFLVSEEVGTTPAATAHIPLQGLLLDAAERLDKLALFRNLIPDVNMCPEIQPGVEFTKLEPRQRLVLGYCDGQRSLKEIGSETWLGRFETLELAYEMIRLGQIRLLPPRQSASKKAKTLVRPYNVSLNEIYEAVEASGEVERVRRELKAWVGENINGLGLQDSLSSEGLVRIESVAILLRESSSRHRLAELHALLHELTSFALFSASLWLVREDERSLTKRINQRLNEIAT